MTGIAPPPTDRFAFLAAVQATGVLQPAAMARAFATLPDRCCTAQQAAEYLVTNGTLSRYQANRVLAGETDGYTLGRYIIEDEISRGATGRVYKAKHTTMNRSVAIKVLKPELTQTPPACASFRHELRAAARLNHPNIVTAYDANADESKPYLVLEFVDGPTLDVLVRLHGPMPVHVACEIVRQIARGLQHAHAQGMIHRDIKPTNLLMAKTSRSGAACLVKIADFGIVRFSSVPEVQPQTSPGILGTPDYISPEQADDPNSVDYRADVYSLGCVFHFLLTGHAPFAGGSTAEKIRRHQRELPARIDHLRADVSPKLAAIVLRLMAKKRKERFQSAGKLIEAIDAFIEHMPIAAPIGVPCSNAFALTATPRERVSPWDGLARNLKEADQATLNQNLTITPPPPLSKHRMQESNRGISGFTLLVSCATLMIGSIVIVKSIVQNFMR